VRSKTGSGRRLLVFGINYAPEPTGTALNNVGLAEGLAARGWQVTVVAGVPHYPAWRRAPAPGDEVRNGVRVIRRPHYVPARQSALRRGAYEATWLLSALPVAASAERPEIVLGIIPALSGGALAAGAALRHGVPFALKVQDIMSRAAEQTAVDGADRVAGAVRRAELALARRADAVAVIAESFREYFLAGGVLPQSVHRVRDPARLGPASEPRETTRARLGWREDEFVALHTGSMGYKQGLETVLLAADRARDDTRLRFVLQGDGNQREKLEALAGDLRLPNVTFLPLAPEDTFASVLQAADVMLLTQRRSVRNMALPAKLSSYFASGRPVLAAVSPHDEVAAELEAAGGGLFVPPDDPDRLLEGVERLRRDPARAAALGAAGRRYAERRLGPRAAVDDMEGFLESVLRERRAPVALHSAA
jgi:colanic acid biosynthesis glycosyl transferase WcaI